jgi:long-chain acyl-CoA synthetase
MNLHDEFRRTAARQPARIAVIESRKRSTVRYGELADLIERVAFALDQAGVGGNDSVGLCLDTGLNYIVATYALWGVGARAVPIAPELTSQEKQEIARQIALTRFVEAVGAEPVPGLARKDSARQLNEQLTCTAVRPFRAHPAGLSGINAAFIRFTSGTTGAAKGVVLSHDSIHARIHAANEGLEIGPKDRVLWLLSMSYHFAVTICAYLQFGAAIVLCHDALPVDMVETGARHETTLVYGAPAQYRGMAAARTPAALNVRLAISTASALPEEVAGSFARRFGRPISQAYGIIEVGLPAINLDPARYDPRSVGPILPTYRLALRDCGLGPEENEILIAGPGMIDAYYEPWQTRDLILSDGWFATGDLGSLDAQGCLHLRGRSKEVINVGGMKFFPDEVERVLREHPAVEDARAFPVPNRRLGEICHAEVVFSPDVDQPSEDDLRRFCALKLATFKIPERIYATAHIARTASGKLRHKPAIEQKPQRIS